MSEREDHRPLSATSRREFLRTTGRAAAVSALAGMTIPTVHAAGSDTIRIALVGCGGRGSGAAVNAMRTKFNVTLIAMADAFADSLANSLANLRRECGNRVDVPKHRQFVGLDAYQKAIDCGADVVLLCTPPGFRPMHFEAAVKAGRHVFMEKPVATDSPGVRRVLAANEQAKKKGLAVGVGFHMRHETKHQEIVRLVHDRAVGDLMFMRAYFYRQGSWIRPRQPGQTEMEHQIRNWYYFTWLAGDQIVEQHIHDVDACNWFAAAHPIEAQGIGGRQVRVGPNVGEVFDHNAVEFTYPNGVKLFSYCRQIPGCYDAFSEHIHGTKGRVDIDCKGTASMLVSGAVSRRWKPCPDGHQVEMDNFFAALQAGRTYNEVDSGAESTMTAILGRMASYSGQRVTWHDAIGSQINLVPKTIAWNGETLVKPGPDGCYACAVPGVTKAF
jgi:myo-inositol 2-dehydrogenase / D-chiro-inositol 1-dehydrogenase